MSTPMIPVRAHGIPLVAGFRLHLADGWQRLHRRGVVVYSGVLGLVSAFGPVLREAWHSMPDDLKAVVPANVQQAIAYTILFTTIIGVRYTSIRKVAGSADGTAASDLPRVTVVDSTDGGAS